MSLKSETPFDELSLNTILFFLERTDFSEPFLGFGFASEVKKELELARERKEMKWDAALSGKDSFPL